MTESRIRCSGRGRKHRLHVWDFGTRPPAEVEWHRDYLTGQKWTVDCRPLLIETREVGSWTPLMLERAG